MKFRYFLLAALALAMTRPASAWTGAETPPRYFENWRDCAAPFLSSEQESDQKKKDQPEQEKEPDCD